MNTTRSSDFAMNEEGIPVCSFLKVLDLEQVFKQRAYPSLLKCCGKCTSVKRGV